MNKSHLTAIARRALPLPTRWLWKKGLIDYEPCDGFTLDFGCGKCHLINPSDWLNYDPHYMPMVLSAYKDYFHKIICNYVLCTLPEAERMPVLKQIQDLLISNGIAYISVNNRKPKWGWGCSKRGTYQGRVRKLPLPLLYECSQFRIYQLTKTTPLVG